MRRKIVFLVDRSGWVFDGIACEISKRLQADFDFVIVYSSDAKRVLSRIEFDLLYIFFWGESCWKGLGIPACKVVKEVASYRWRDQEEYGFLDADSLCRRYLSDCTFVTTPCGAIADELGKVRGAVVHLENGIDSAFYRPYKQRRGALKIGWAGNPKDPLKGLYEFVLPASKGYEFLIADGGLSKEDMLEFYNSIDVIVIGSLSEGQPMPLLEAMACGCYPVATSVGIVPEVIGGLAEGVVVERDVESFRAAFMWCSNNLDYIRSCGLLNSKKIRSRRDWGEVVPRIKRFFYEAINMSDGAVLALRGKEEGVSINTPSEPKIVDGEADYAEHLSNIQSSYGEDYERVRGGLQSELAELLPSEKDQVILEIGSGFGYLANLLLDLGYSNVHVADKSKNLIDFVRQNHGGRLKAAFWCDASDVLRANESKVDVIILYDVLEHIDLSGLKEFSFLLCRALKRGGKVIIRTPNMALPLSSFSRYIDVTHNIGFTEFSLVQLLKGGGFSEVRVVEQKRKMKFWDGVLFKAYRVALRRLYRLENRTVPKCLDKNIIVEAYRV